MFKIFEWKSKEEKQEMKQIKKREEWVRRRDYHEKMFLLYDSMIMLDNSNRGDNNGK